MANDYFQFKKFRINQAQAPFRVCTDSCIFGAWIKPDHPQSILDIGTGTGLLSLMMAQRFAAQIDAVEINDKAYQSACENIAISSWSNRIKVYWESVQQYAEQKTQTYDVIITNPPFFKDHHTTADPDKNQALHNQYLPFSDLLEVVLKLLHPSGEFYIMLPEWEFNQFEQMAGQAQLILNKKLTVKNQATEPVFRMVGAYSFYSSECKREYLTIRNGNKYTPEFIELLKDYYLYL
ncbi:MAG: tRNA1(Val) (adenine(37)-N6)-methyltransferase [Candidatus Cyclobacteriaceae bacterium M3_2C_046]